MKGKLRWKKQPYEIGLRAVGAGPRSSDLWDGEIEYATVSAIGGGWRGPVTGWYWYAGTRDGVAYRNTCSSPTSEIEAKKQAMAYIKACLSKATNSNLTEGLAQGSPQE